MVTNRVSQQFQFSDWGYPSFSALLDRAIAELGTTLYESASVTTRSHPDAEAQFDSIAEWRKHIEQTWSDLTRLRFYATSSRGRISVFADREDALVDISVETPLAADGAALAAVLGNALGAEPKSTAAPSLSRGIRSRYFIGDALTSSSSDKLVAFLRSQIKPRAGVTARIRFNNGEDHTFGELAAWHDEALREWQNLTELYFHTWTPGRRITVTCDIWRQLLTLEVEALADAEVGSIVAGFTNLLSLTPAPDQVYRYRRFGRYYRIRKWTSNKEVAEAIRKIIDKSFATPPALVNGFLTLGGAEQQLRPASSIPHLLEEAASDQSYDELKIYVEGARGGALGIYINRAKSRLEVRSSLDPTRFEIVIDGLKDVLALKPQGELSPGEEDSDKKDPRLVRVLTAVGTAVLGLFTIEAVKYVRAEDKLAITFPHRAEGKEAAVVTGDTIYARWVVRRTRAGDTHDVSPCPEGVVRLYDHAGKEVFSKRGTNAAEVEFPSADGNYQISVEIPQLGKSESIAVTKSTSGN